MMKPTEQLHALGQSLWLDNITRDMLDNGTLQRYIDDFSITGLTSNPSIFEHAITGSSAYDDEIGELREKGLPEEELFFELALHDLVRAADLFAPAYKRTSGVDGFVSLELSPLLAYDVDQSVAAARRLHGRAGRSNLFIKIPGTNEGVRAIEEAIFAGVPINVTLLFSREQYLASLDAYLMGLERRMAAGLDLDVRSVASVFVSRWDKAVADRVPDPLSNYLGVAVGQQIYRAYRNMLDSERWQRLASYGARPQRLLFASTGVKDPNLSETFYVAALAAPNTINTLPEKTLVAFQQHGQLNGTLPRSGGNCEEILAQFRRSGIDLEQVAVELQREGARAFHESWQNMLASIYKKGSAVQIAAADRQALQPVV
jgi:transaldolase